MTKFNQNSWQIKGFKALAAAIVAEVVALEAYMGTQFNLRPDTTPGSTFLKGIETVV
ncbi:hypothetical protein D3C72_258820 [compost metagenome]